MLTRSLWCVIDPAYDRPFFSSSPPADTLQLGKGGCVVRYDYQVHDMTPAVMIVEVNNEEEARKHALDLFWTTKKAT